MYKCTLLVTYSITIDTKQAHEVHSDIISISLALEICLHLLSVQNRWVTLKTRLSCLQASLILSIFWGMRKLTRGEGGGSGIGAATVRAFYARGARVVFGDINEENGRKVAGEFDEKRVLFRQMDVTKYEDNLSLIKHAFESFGAVDHAVYIAGILESGNLFDPGLTIEDVEKASDIFPSSDLLGSTSPCYTQTR